MIPSSQTTSVRPSRPWTWQRIALAAALGSAFLLGLRQGEGAASPARDPLGTLSRTPLAGASLDEGSLPGANCGLRAGTLERSVGPGGVTLRAQVQTQGRAAVELRALQASWQGPYRLRALNLGGKLLPAGQTSPALLPLGGSGANTVQPGKPIEVLLDFVRDAGESPSDLVLGPLLLVGVEGCSLALVEAPDPKLARCGLAVDATGPIADRPQLFGVSLVNRGAAAVRPLALELAWPVAQNGALVGWQLAYRAPGTQRSDLWRAKAPGLPLPPRLGLPGLDGPTQQLPTPPPGLNLGRSPLVLPLAGYARGIMPENGLPPRGALDLTFGFQAAAAAKGYRLSVVGSDGCRVNSSDLAQDDGCAVALQRLRVDGRKVVVQLSNTGALTSTLVGLSLQWDPRRAGKLSELWLSGRPLSFTATLATPLNLQLESPVAIGPGQFADLALVFEAPFVAPAGAIASAPSDRPGQGLGLGDLAILARFSDACNASLSTVRPDEPLACRLSGGELAPDPATEAANDVSTLLTNDGGDARLRQLTLRWPMHNGALLEAWLDDQLLTKGPHPHNPDLPLRLDLPEPGPTIGRGQKGVLRLVFALPAARLGYSGLADFVDSVGEPCASLRLASLSSEVDCQLGGSLKVIDDSRADLTIQNRGQDPLALSELQIDWPKDDGWQLTRLLGASVIRGLDSEQDLGLQPNLPPPVALRWAEQKLPSVSVPAGSDDVRISLRFAQLRSPERLAEVLKVSLAFAEGCRLNHPRDGSIPGPSRLTLDATIIALPAAEQLFTGTWQLRDSQDKVWQVEVSSDTALLPGSFLPRIGDRVQALLELDGNGLWWATQLRLLSGRPERRVVGEVTDIVPADDGAGLPAAIQVEDRKVLLVEGFTVVDKPEALALGAIVVAEGIVDRQNRFVASRVAVSSQAIVRPEAITYRGVVQGGAPPVGDPPFPGVVMSWVITPYTVYAGPDLAARLAVQNLLGRPVEVRGERLGDWVLATDISPLAAAPAPTERIEGILVALPAGGLQGDWLIDRGQDGTPDLVTLHVPNLAVIDSRDAPALLGNRVQASVRQQDGQRLVLSLRLAWP